MENQGTGNQGISKVCDRNRRVLVKKGGVGLHWLSEYCYCNTVPV